jgi:glycosyltransferase involved in cell wall biosynthesis
VILGAKGVVFSLPLLVKQLIQKRVDVVISALDYANVVAIVAGKMTHTPVMISEHSTASLSLSNSPSRKARMVGWLMKMLYPCAKGVVAVSKGVASDLKRFVSKTEVSTIYNPVLETFPPLEKQEIVHPFLGGNHTKIIAAGRLTPPKNFPLLLEAFKIFLDDDPTATLIILGEGEERGVLEEMIIKLGIGKSVDLVGFVDHPMSWFEKSDLFVLSSSWEGLGNVLVEALASGCQVVSTRCPSGPEEVLQGGLWGELVEVGNAHSLCEGMKKALVNSKPKPPSEYFEQFSIRYATNKYLQLAQKVVDEKR